MSTTTFIEPATAAEMTHKRTLYAPMMRRFLWKETRVLRGLWLAVLAMGVVVQWVVNTLTPTALGPEMLLFSIALAATVLYAVGAAATIFSVEHEEETYSFLAGLPVTWWPVFAGKLAVVFAGALALAAGLSIVGWMICGFDTPDSRDTFAALGLFGIAVVEGIAWGTLFSLLVKRPLVAAMLTIVLGSVATNVIVNSASSYAVASLSPDAYTEVMPVRLATAAIVVLASAVLARSWLVTGSDARGVRLGPPGLWKRIRSRLQTRYWPQSTSMNAVARRTMLARLVWQTWRDAWKLLLVCNGDSPRRR